MCGEHVGSSQQAKQPGNISTGTSLNRYAAMTSTPVSRTYKPCARQDCISWLHLRDAEDVGLLRRLPRLKRAELLLWEKEGEEAAAAVEEIRQGLQGGGGAGVGAGLCDGVEVAVVRYRW